tara:strand:- start:2480 stop:2668 length:189 start_codon:yes stop_codon:yes gene_type:complete
MCIICVELEKDKLTIAEARRNLGEMWSCLDEHAVEVEDFINEKEIEKMLEVYADEIDDIIYL